MRALLSGIVACIASENKSEALTFNSRSGNRPACVWYACHIKWSVLNEQEASRPALCRRQWHRCRNAVFVDLAVRSGLSCLGRWRTTWPGWSSTQTSRGRCSGLGTWQYPTSSCSPRFYSHLRTGETDCPVTATFYLSGCISLDAFSDSGERCNYTIT